MNPLRLLMTIFIGFAAPTSALTQEKHFVGEVYIVGNTYTPDYVIRAQINLYPGQVLRYPEIRVAERNLSKLNWFLVDEQNKIRPTVAVLDNDGPFKDVMVKVHERPGNWARLAFWEVVLARNTMDYSRLLDAAKLIHMGIRESRTSK